MRSARGCFGTGFWHSLAPLIAENDPTYADLEPRALFEQWVKQNTPLQREQTPEDIGNLVVFLSSEEGPEHHRTDHPCRWRRVNGIANLAFYPIWITCASRADSFNASQTRIVLIASAGQRGLKLPSPNNV